MFTKVCPLSAYISGHKLDIICFSKSFFHSEIPNDDKNLEISEYNLVREDHSFNSKRGGVCVYFKCSLPFKVTNVTYLQECISFELIIGGKFCQSSCLYRFLSQALEEFETFLKNFAITR